MANKTYNEYDIIRILSKNFNINIDSVKKVIKTLKDANNIGNGTYGKISYLVKVHGYTHEIVNKLSNKRKLIDNDDNNNVDYKPTKRNKINMVSMVKTTIKKNKR